MPDNIDRPTEYRANDPNEIIGELFSGKLSMQEAIRRLRIRLLDLTSRNRLLNYRHPKNRCVQMVDAPGIDVAFERLLDNKSFLIKWVPEPEPLSYTGKRPEARQHAETLRINTAYGFPSFANGRQRRGFGLQTLYYPVDLERLLRKMSTEAKRAIEETGSNMLFLIFGFLEFYENDESEKPWLAPIISVPVMLERAHIDAGTRVYQYTLSYNGEDVTENHTLREKLRQDFSLMLPELEEEETPETYFGKIEKAVASKKRWKIRRQLTLGMLAFGKLAIWADLDHNKWQGLLDHPLLKMIFGGGATDGDVSLYAEDYKIDESEQANLPLIYTADSSQHSAIIDVLAGKNLVINGPPGTGKSQTITNVIGCALSQGKKILFVSEKLAALEVVQRRLNQAGLGEFCLELHSNRTQKRKLIESLEDRLSKSFPPVQLGPKLSALTAHKEKLARYAELMGSRVGNELGLTVNEILWAAEHRRQQLGESADELSPLVLAGAKEWTYDDLQRRRGKAEEIGNLFPAVGSYSPRHPWWGFAPEPLMPGDDRIAAEILLRAIEEAHILTALSKEYLSLAGEDSLDMSAYTAAASSIDRIPDPPNNLLDDLLPTFFTLEDMGGHAAEKVLDRVSGGISKARSLLDAAASVLLAGHGLTVEEAQPAFDAANKECLPSVLEDTPATLLNLSNTLQGALVRFEHFYPISPAGYSQVTEEFLRGLGQELDASAGYNITEVPIGILEQATAAVMEKHGQLSAALKKVRIITENRGIPFDGSPESATRLRLSGPPDLKKGPGTNDEELVEAGALCQFPLSGYSLAKLREVEQGLRSLWYVFGKSFEFIRSTAHQSGIAFDGTEDSVCDVAAIAEIAGRAPHELLPCRNHSFGHASTADLITKVEEGIGREVSWRTELESSIYLDVLPPTEDLKSHIRTFRQGEKLFNFLNKDWRHAKKAFNGLAREKRKRKADECVEILAKAVSWAEHRQKFVSNAELKECFGVLFCGFETDTAKIRSLYTWYQQSRQSLLKRPGLADRVDLTSFDANRMGELSAKAGAVSFAASSVLQAYETARTVLGADVASFDEAREKGCTAYLAHVLKFSQDADNIVRFFSQYVDPSLSPQRALELMEAARELDQVSGELARLGDSEEVLRAGGQELPYLGSTKLHSWFQYLPSIEKSCVTIQHLMRYLEGFPKESSPASAQGFVQTKLALDEVLKPTAAGWRAIIDWPHYIEKSRSVLAVFQSLASPFSGKATDGKSVKDCFAALLHEAEAGKTLSGFAADRDVGSMLGRYFSGLDTDLDALRVTLAWGKAVSSSGLPKVVAGKVLQAEPVAHLYTVKEIVAKVLSSFDNVSRILSELKQFGSFDWEGWQGQIRSRPGKDLPEEVRQRLETAFDGLEGLFHWSKYLAVRMRCLEEGLDEFVRLMESDKTPPSLLSTAVEFAAYQSVAKNIYKKFPELTRFSGVSHEKIRQDYRAIDRDIISLTGADLARRVDAQKNVPYGSSGPRAGDFTQLQLIQREIAKQRRHIPIRQLLKRAGKAVQELKPCFMMGPLSVAQYLEPGSVKFDLILMDEASQLKPEEAIGAIGRGAQLVVVGDPKQLPPTNFFERMLESGEEEDEEATPAVQGMESILDICQQLFTPVRSLRWHYRSQHDSLIAFSNFHFYKNLVVFPSPFRKAGHLGVRYHYVTDGAYRDRQNIPEAQTVVDAVCEHMLQHGDESLGVVTLNQTQRDLIEELLDRRLRIFVEGQQFLSHHEKEGWPLFVKNLENVQGDERDVIMISTTFGKAPGTDRVRQNYGPISRPDGWRRLNVLFTRARRRVHLFTSMVAEDIIVDEKTPQGTKALRDYLDFAKKGILSDSGVTGREPESDFELAVAAVLSAKGYQVIPQFGVAGFYIDMVVRNPDRPGELLAAIECDGATYHSGLSVRDRDRIRQEVLESLGWKGRIWRIWSTDWFYNPRRETGKLFEFLDGCCAARRAEAVPEYEIEVGDAEKEQPSSQKEVRLEDEVREALSLTAAGDIFAEVGNRVTYCFKESPESNYGIWIVDGPSNPQMKMINEKTPVAEALLGLSPGEENEIELPGQPVKTIRLLKIEKA